MILQFRYGEDMAVKWEAVAQYRTPVPTLGEVSDYCHVTNVGALRTVRKDAAGFEELQAL